MGPCPGRCLHVRPGGEGKTGRCEILKAAENLGHSRAKLGKFIFSTKELQYDRGRALSWTLGKDVGTAEEGWGLRLMSPGTCLLSVSVSSSSGQRWACVKPSVCPSCTNPDSLLPRCCHFPLSPGEKQHGQGARPWGAWRGPSSPVGLIPGPLSRARGQEPSSHRVCVSVLDLQPRSVRLHTMPGGDAHPKEIPGTHCGERGGETTVGFSGYHLYYPYL